MNPLALPHAIQFTPLDAISDERTRLRQYEAWLAESGRTWHVPDLKAYRDHLIDVRRLSPNTARNYLGTVRSRYRDLATDNHLRDVLYAMTDGDAGDRKAFVDECIVRITNAIDTRKVRVKVHKKQDRTDDELRWLTTSEVARLRHAIRMQAPNELTYWRDASLVTLGLITGARREELARVQVDDLRQSLGGEMALLIKAGKGHKQRLVPYGVMASYLDTVDCWLSIAGITNGYVFRGFTSNRKKVLNSGCSVETVNNIVSAYTFGLDSGEATFVRPHDLRRTYAGNFFRAFGWGRIQQLSENLGHESIKTTIVYLGLADASSRAPEKDLFEE